MDVLVYDDATFNIQLIIETRNETSKSSSSHLDIEVTWKFIIHQMVKKTDNNLGENIIQDEFIIC